MVPQETFKIWASKSAFPALWGKKKVILTEPHMLYFPAFYSTVLIILQTKINSCQTQIFSRQIAKSNRALFKSI